MRTDPIVAAAEGSSLFDLCFVASITTTHHSQLLVTHETGPCGPGL